MSQTLRPKGQSIKSPYSTNLTVLILIYHPVNNNAKYNKMFIQRIKNASKLFANSISNKINKRKNLCVNPILYNKYNYTQIQKQNKEKLKNIKSINNQKCNNKENNTPFHRDESTNYKTRKPSYISDCKHKYLKKKTTGNMKLKVQPQSFIVTVYHALYIQRSKSRYHRLDKDSRDVYNIWSQCDRYPHIEEAHPQQGTQTAQHSTNGGSRYGGGKQTQKTRATQCSQNTSESTSTYQNEP
jgi:hypothetical protein